VTLSRIRVVAAQPKAIVEPDPEANVAWATEMVARAAALDADLVLFPEGYPGPILRTPTATYEARDRMADAAAAHTIAVCWSRMERCEDGHYRLVVYVVDRDGTELLRYARAHPATIPPHETEVWVAPGEELGFVRIGGVAMGIAVCSELWVPETTRVLALQGAEVILSPAGGGFTTLTSNWQLLARARAIENHCYVVLTNNIWRDEMGAAMIAGPEHVAAASGFEDLVAATLDLDRVRWLRANDDSLAEPKPFWSIPGLTRARRPELYEELVKPGADLYDFATPQGGGIE
jgi:predicted amidohydrolase